MRLKLQGLVCLVTVSFLTVTAWQDDDKCGTQTVALDPETKIVGGKAAQEGEWPWQAALYVEGRRICGASLITPEWIVTAGHCVDVLNEPQIYEFMVGSNSLSDVSENNQRIPVAGVYMHPDYGTNDTSTYDADICLMKMAAPYNITDHVRTVCVPQKSQEDGFAAGTPVTITGWGATYQGGPQNPDELMEVEVPVVDQQECIDYYSPEPITDNMICAGLPEGGKDSCQGDSGGPLVGQIDGRWYLGGVVSWGFGCAQPLLPGVYTRVTEFEDWIAPIFEGGEPDKKTSDCKADEFLCKGGWCIDIAYKCNGGYSCYYDTDEAFCESNSIYFNPYYYEKLSPDSIVETQSVETVNACAELCLGKSDTCKAFDTIGNDTVGFQCSLAGSTYTIVNVTSDQDKTVHFKMETFPEPNTVLTSSGGRIASPKWLDGTTETEGWFTWSINPQSSSFNAMRFNFITSVDPSQNCEDSDSTNMLIVRSGDSVDSPVVGAYCLDSVPEHLEVLSSSAMAAARVEFYSPAAMENGFLASYESYFYCDNEFIENTGTFQSPNYPDNYPNNVNCRTHMKAPEGSVVRLDITDFSIELDGSEEGVCPSNWDTFRVYDGESEEAPLIGEYCGDMIPEVFMSSGMHLLVVFKSDFSATGRGYTAEVSFTAGSTMTPPTMSEPEEVQKLREKVKEQEKQLDSFKYSLAAVCAVCALLTMTLIAAIFTLSKRETKIATELNDLKKDGNVNKGYAE